MMKAIHYIFIKFRVFLGRAIEVGQDVYGNRYFMSTAGAPSRRWVVYKGMVEPSKVPPLWQSWLTFTRPSPPTTEMVSYAWQKPFTPNLTGTRYAYYYTQAQPHKMYVPWTPKH